MMNITRHKVNQVHKFSWGKIQGVRMDDFIEISNSYTLLSSSLEVVLNLQQKKKNKYEDLLEQANSKMNFSTNNIGWYFVSDANKFLDSQCLKINFKNVRTPHFTPQALDLVTSIFLVYDHVSASSGGKCPFRCFKISEKWAKALAEEGDHLQVNEDLFKFNKISLRDFPLYHEIEVRIHVNPLTRVSSLSLLLTE